jgi:hypothetical protein
MFQSSFTNRLNNVLFDSGSHNLLNNFTLEVKDDEIARAVKEQNASNFRAAYNPLLIISACYAVWRVFDYVVFGLTPIKLFSSFVYLFYTLLILIIRQKYPYTATRVIWLFILHWGI